MQNHTVLTEGFWGSWFMSFVSFLLMSILAASGTVSVDEITPGTTGWGLTVFRGTEPDTFGVEVVGLMPSSAPGDSRLLVRLTGELAESTGVAAGMSGSPVYVGENLVGALSGSFPFSQQPIATVTPIEGMLRPEIGEAGSATSWGGVTPLFGVGSGFDQQTLSFLTTGFGDLGITFRQSGSVVDDITAELSPGDPLAAVMVSGDWALAAIGTVTWKEGGKLAAFGHPLMGLGSVDLPLAGARIAATVASVAHAFKVGNPGQIAGRISFDGTNGILGQIGEMPKLLPLTVQVLQPKQRTFKLCLAVHPAITPMLFRACVLNCSGVVGGTATLDARVDLSAYFAGGRERQFVSVGRGPGALGAAGEELGQLLSLVMNSPLGAVVPDSLTVTVSMDQRPDEYFLKSAAIDHATLRGENRTVSVSVLLLSTEGKTIRHVVELAVPSGALGERLSVIIADGPTMKQWEYDRAPLTHVPQDLEHYLNELFHPWAPDRLYVALVSKARGWTRRGSEVSRLPPSYVDILSHATQRGSHDLSTMSVLSRGAIDLDGKVYGSTTLELHRQEGKAP
jgi:hypothetical protein